jgi:predicted HAD superfamily Cof-like phosphohydrolase
VRNLDREDKVAQFHQAFGHPINKGDDDDLIVLRNRLIQEEYDELKDEMAAAMVDIQTFGQISTKTKARMLKEMADLQYVLSGLAVALGLPLQIAFNRVHASNMSKLGKDGKPILREDGKILKSELYIPPDLEDLVE